MIMLFLQQVYSLNSRYTINEKSLFNNTFYYVTGAGYYEADKVNKNLSVIEQVRKFILFDEEFTIENDMMTPTMKVKRFKVKNIFGAQLEELY